tara:strand:+ start:569 stop:862 length:294 start_codon:yes stop_codon:yes gene_type:complete
VLPSGSLCFPAARGLGIDRALIEATYELADESGTPSVYWMTQEFNHNARMLYDRIGTLTPFIKCQRQIRTEPMEINNNISTFPGYASTIQDITSIRF